MASVEANNMSILDQTNNILRALSEESNILLPLVAEATSQLNEEQMDNLEPNELREVESTIDDAEKIIMLHKRKQVLKEIFMTERNYVTDLSVLVCLFLRPLQVDMILSRDDISAIFLNIEVIYKLGHEFLLKLESVFPDPNSIDPELSLGNLLLQIGHFLKIYSTYCSSCKSGMEHSIICAKNNATYEKFLKETQASEQCKGLSLHDYLIKPVQRICKYPLLFGELAKFTPKNHPDYSAVVSTQALFQSVAEITNRNSADKENMDKLANFVQVVDGFHDDNHFSCGRQAILDEWMDVIISRNPVTACHVYLFNDMLVVTKRIRRKSNAPLNNSGPGRLSMAKIQKSERLKCQVVFKSFYLKDTTAEENRNQFTLLPLNPSTTDVDLSYSFICPNSGSKTKWMEELKRLIPDKENIVPDLSASGRPMMLGAQRSKNIGKKSNELPAGKANMRKEVSAGVIDSVSRTSRNREVNPELPRNNSRLDLGAAVDLYRTSNKSKDANPPAEISRSNSKDKNSGTPLTLADSSDANKKPARISNGNVDRSRKVSISMIQHNKEKDNEPTFEDKRALYEDRRGSICEDKKGFIGEDKRGSVYIRERTNQKTLKRSVRKPEDLDKINSFKKNLQSKDSDNSISEGVISETESLTELVSPDSESLADLKSSAPANCQNNVQPLDKRDSNIMLQFQKRFSNLPITRKETPKSDSIVNNGKKQSFMSDLFSPSDIIRKAISAVNIEFHDDKKVEILETSAAEASITDSIDQITEILNHTKNIRSNSALNLRNPVVPPADDVSSSPAAKNELETVVESVHEPKTDSPVQLQIQSPRMNANFSPEPVSQHPTPLAKRNQVSVQKQVNTPEPKAVMLRDSNASTPQHTPLSARSEVSDMSAQKATPFSKKSEVADESAQKQLNPSTPGPKSVARIRDSNSDTPQHTPLSARSEVSDMSAQKATPSSKKSEVVKVSAQKQLDPNTPEPSSVTGIRERITDTISPMGRINQQPSYQEASHPPHMYPPQMPNYAPQGQFPPHVPNYPQAQYPPYPPQSQYPFPPNPYYPYPAPGQYPEQQPYPGQTVPPQTFPGQSAPHPFPGQTAPQPFPSQAVPPMHQSIPGQTAPPQTFPGQTAPPQTFPGQTGHQHYPGQAVPPHHFQQPPGAPYNMYNSHMGNYPYMSPYPYYNMYAPPAFNCGRCMVPIGDGTNTVMSQNRMYHSKCYLCSRCNESLVDKKVVQSHTDNNLYCSECYVATLNAETLPK